jgi:small-conductance mechanosensitive channel
VTAMLECDAIQTELATAVYAALHAAAMSLPFPQREVRVLHDPAARSPC